MKKTILINKKEGETPLEALERFRKVVKGYQGVPMTYAGRLDPMASGLLIVLAGEKVREKEKYLNLDKEYEFEMLFGFCTDTHDILGKVLMHENITIGEKEIKNELKKFLGKQMQKYPKYSSRTVRGRPLFMYARSEEEVTVPEKEINIKRLNLISVKKVSSKKLIENIERRIKKVKGDFRQKEILKIWYKYLGKESGKYIMAKVHIKCSSGTYVRVLSDALGRGLGIPSLAYNIKRTKVGRFML